VSAIWRKVTFLKGETLVRDRDFGLVSGTAWGWSESVMLMGTPFTNLDRRSKSGYRRIATIRISSDCHDLLLEWGTRLVRTLNAFIERNWAIFR